MCALVSFLIHMGTECDLQPKEEATELYPPTHNQKVAWGEKKKKMGGGGGGAVTTDATKTRAYFVQRPAAGIK